MSIDTLVISERDLENKCEGGRGTKRNKMTFFLQCVVNNIKETSTETSKKTSTISFFVYFEIK